MAKSPCSETEFQKGITAQNQVAAEHQSAAGVRRQAMLLEFFVAERGAERLRRLDGRGHATAFFVEPNRAQ